jgi:hypothetical protein
MRKIRTLSVNAADVPLVVRTRRGNIFDQRPAGQAMNSCSWLTSANKLIAAASQNKIDDL